MTNRVLNAMPMSSTVYVYGILDGPQIKNLDIMHLIHRNATVTGFFLKNWLEKKGTMKMLPRLYKLGKLMKNELKSDIAMECCLENFEESINIYYKNMTKGKVILKPFGTIEKKVEQTEKGEPIKSQPK